LLKEQGFEKHERNTQFIYVFQLDAQREQVKVPFRNLFFLGGGRVFGSFMGYDLP
jgi:hypothetical protein